jgi:hypothetical protein
MIKIQIPEIFGNQIDNIAIAHLNCTIDQRL